MNNKEKNDKLTRVIYASLAVLLCGTAVIAAISMGVMRRAKDGLESTRPGETTISPDTTRAPAITRAPDTTRYINPDTTEPDPLYPDVPDTQITPGANNYGEVDLPAPSLPVFSVPVAGDVAKHHDSESAVYSLTMDDWRVHLGIDIACDALSDVKAAADGTVSQIWDDPLMGKCIAISHTGTGMSIYKNLLPELPTSVSVGAVISEGDVIGKVGESAIIEIADEPHLHFELTVGGVHVDPLEYFDKNDMKLMLGE